MLLCSLKKTNQIKELIIRSIQLENIFCAKKLIFIKYYIPKINMTNWLMLRFDEIKKIGFDVKP